MWSSETGQLVPRIQNDGLHSTAMACIDTAVTMDPTTQIPWPGARKRSDRDVDPQETVRSNGNSRYNSPRRPSVIARDELNGKRRLSTFDLFNLSISMAGAQVAWTVELG